MKSWLRSRPLRTALIYIVFGSLWILISDNVLDALIPHTSQTYIQAQTIKGWLFILFSALLLLSIMQSDMKALKKNEEELRKNEMKYRALFNQTHDAVFILDLQGYHLDANQRAAAMLGYTREELIGLKFSDISAEKEKSEIIFNQLLQGDQIPLYERIFKKKNGETIPVEVNVELVRDSHGMPFHIQSTIRDITERKKFEETLRRSEILFFKIFRSSPIGINIFRLSDGRSYNANDAFLELAGYPREELINHSAAELNLFVDTEIRNTWMASLKEGRRVVNQDARIRRKSGEIRNSLASLDIIEINGEAMILTIAVDITERKNAEAHIRTQLKRLSALNSIDRAISSSLNIQTALDILLGEVVSQLEVDSACILLFNNTSQVLENAASRGFSSPFIHQTSVRLGDELAGKVGRDRKVLHIPNLPELGNGYQRWELIKAEEFREYFGVPLIAKGQFKGVLEIFNRKPLHPDVEWLDYLETLGEQAAIAIESAQLFEGLQRSNQELTMAYDATIAGWSRAMDLRDKETEGHTKRVSNLTIKLAEFLGISPQEQIHIRRGALLHDIGKLGVPDYILHKPGKLTEEEWDIMRKHPTYAHDMLISINYLRPALDIPYCHHEKWDGSGYPRGLKGEDIPLSARIFAIVDVWDALRSDRPYRSGWSAQQTYKYIQTESGKHFDPKIVDVFLKMLDESPEWF